MKDYAGAIVAIALILLVAEVSTRKEAATVRYVLLAGAYLSLCAMILYVWLLPD